MSDTLLPEELEEKLISLDMAKIGDNHRSGAVCSGSEVINPLEKKWIKSNSEMNEFMNVEQNREPLKGLRKDCNS
ncbi:hypothetical protein FFF34_017295 [Inquilinus sp. KBS0705]|nr:hypothetical protein FFF34_017295 [Inquilinus sp. KBS0705]